MGLATGNETIANVVQSTGREKSDTAPATTHEAQKSALSPADSLSRHDHSTIVARATNDAVRDLDLATGQLSWPQGLQSLLGYESAPLTAKIGFWNERVHPEDRVRVATSIREAISGETEFWSGEYRFRHADDSYLLLLERALIVRDDSGRALRLVGSLMDITARKQLQDQLCRSQKMEAFGQLAGGAAHDFNNFLTTILGYSDLVLAETGVKGMVANHVAEIRKAAGRASNLTGQLLAFSRKQALEPRDIEVNSLIVNLERSVLRLLGDNVTVACHLHQEKESAHIKADPGQLTQIILNLAVNARDAMPHGGRLIFKTGIATLSEDRQSKPGIDDLPPGDYVTIAVIDNGVGMSDEVKAHLFEPFFTTKGEGTGSGLGLATSYGIIRQSGGRIYVESEVGKGTRVQIYLPKVLAPPAPSYKKPGSRNLPTGTETILVLEDDISVRHISVRVLRNLGYQVIEAANGDDAQRLITQSASREIHLLLTDVVMPQMSGRHFADWLRKVSPHTKVVFVSGYLDESLQRVDHGMFFLPKPFDPEQLAQSIRHALDS
jgi:two-component system, cell cycle sensor histidine kinase and response regulator CckA